MIREEIHGRGIFQGQGINEGKGPNRQTGSTQAGRERIRRNSIMNAAVLNDVLAGPSPAS